ncbi:diguanylate cyclase response regulator [Candidatus Sumerlaeota bacterium]|nr:diguanylate cyclase response regulator [Candidatus Sumerlaeota bacterium]
MSKTVIRILLIDDDEEDYILTKDMLSGIEDVNFKLDWVSTYEDGLNAIKCSEHDVYLIDYRLGAKDGLELMREALAYGCSAPMLLLTSQGDRKVDLSAMHFGAAGYLEKAQLSPSLLERSIRYAIQHQKLKESLKALSLYDDLTGLYNRRGFLTLAEQQIKIADRKKREMYLIFADVDGMKWINDNFGHCEGDRVLIEIAGLLKNTFRKSDIIARIAGDEFVILVLDATRESTNYIIARLQNNLSKYNRERTFPFPLSLSFGVAHYDPMRPCSIEEILEQADALMYEQKREKYNSLTQKPNLVD